MSRATLVALGLLVFGLAALGAITWHLVSRDRAAFVARFAAESLRQVSETARGVEAEIGDVAEDLDLARRLVGASSTTEEAHRILSILLGSVKPYRAATVYAPDGRTLCTALDPRKRPVPPKIIEAMAQTARDTLTDPRAGIGTSRPLPGGSGDWFRVFAAPFPAGGGRRQAIALLVDTRPFLERFRLLASGSGSGLLVIGPHGQPAPVSSAALARALGGLPLAKVLARMRAGARGTTTLDRRDAAALGLGTAEVMVAHAPIRIRGSAPWSVAVLTSAATLRAHERATLWRLGLLSAGIALALIVFGSYVIVASRRTAVLRERLRHASELAYLHEKADKILDTIPTGVIAISEKGRISSVNRALSQRVPQEALGGELARAFPAAPTATVELLSKLVERARTTRSPCRLPGEQVALFGEEGQYTIHAVPLEASLPEASVLVVIEDVTEVRALESQLLRAEKLATVGVLAAGVAHEVGTPLSVVRGRAEYVMGKLGPDHPEAAGLKVIVDQIDRVTRIIRELLDFSRVKPATVVPVALSPLVRKVVDLLQYDTGRRKVRVETDVPESLPLLSANPDQLQQVLVNLLMNAADACREDGRITISAGVADDGESLLGRHVCLEIADDGCGIPAELHHRVFDPFFTTKKRGQGTGLGLTIVNQIAGNHGARVNLQSEPGAGTRVVLRWPVLSDRGSDGNARDTRADRR